jgi:hypothetical protein
MTTSPKGFTQLAGTDAPNGPSQINAAELFVENLIGENVSTVSALPSSGNWVGRSIFVTGIGEFRVWNGSAWVTPTHVGLIPVVPTSVSLTGGTSATSPNGVVAFTGSGAVLLNGVFSSSFQNYLIRLRTESSAIAASTTNTALNVRLSKAGTPSTASSYFRDSATNGQSWGNGVNGGNGHTLDLYLFAPFLPSYTTGRWASTSWNGATGQISPVVSGVGYPGTDAWDGIQAIFNGTATGTIQVFGYLD